MLDFLKNSVDIKTYKGNVKQRVKKDKSKEVKSGGAKTNSINITGVRLLKN
jgi:hypothetical protein